MSPRDRLAVVIIQERMKSRGIDIPEELPEWAMEIGRRGADVVLGVLPDILTDPQLIKTVAQDVEQSWMHVQDVLIATTKVIVQTDDIPEEIAEPLRRAASGPAPEMSEELKAEIRQQAQKAGNGKP